MSGVFFTCECGASEKQEMETPDEIWNGVIADFFVRGREIAVAPLTYSASHL